jgi:hypothetical protein
MDPRAQITAAELNEQLQLGLEIFDDVRRTRMVLAELESVKKRLGEVKPQLTGNSPELLAQIASLEAAITKIQKGGKPLPGAITGLELAGTGLSAALRVVETSDRKLPSQAIELYRQADQAARTGIAAWTEVKNTELPKLNQALQQAGAATIQISEIEQDVEYWMSE